MLYEALLLFAVAFLATWLFQFAAGTVQIDGWRLHALQAFLLSVFAAYFLWCWLRGGQTLAMKTWRVRLSPAAMPGCPRGLRCCASSMPWRWFLPWSASRGRLSTATASSCMTGLPAAA